MSAFLQSGRSDHGISQISRVRFRPQAAVHTLGALAVESTGEELHSPVHFHALEEPGDHRVEIARSPPRTVGERTGAPKHTVVSIGEDPDRKVRVFAVT